MFGDVTAESVLEHGEKFDVRSFATQLSEKLSIDIQSLLISSFKRLRRDIDDRKLYILFEKSLGCNPQEDHKVPRSVLPLFEPFISDIETNALNATLVYVKEMLRCDINALCEDIYSSAKKDSQKLAQMRDIVFDAHARSLDQDKIFDSLLEGKARDKTRYHQEIQYLREQLFSKKTSGERMFRPDFGASSASAAPGIEIELAGSSRLQKLLEAKEDRISELQTKLRVSGASSTDAVQELAEKTTALKNLQHELAELRQENHDALERFHALLETSKADREQLDSTIQELQEEIDGLRGKDNPLFTELNEQNEHIQSLQNEISEVTERYVSLSKEHDEALSRADMTHKMITNQATKLQDNLSAKTQLLASLQQTLLATNKDLEAAQLDTRNLKQTLSKAETQLLSATKKIDNLQKSNDRLKAQYSLLKTRSQSELPRDNLQIAESSSSGDEADDHNKDAAEPALVTTELDALRQLFYELVGLPYVSGKEIDAYRADLFMEPDTSILAVTKKLGRKRLAQLTAGLNNDNGAEFSFLHPEEQARVIPDASSIISMLKNRTTLTDADYDKAMQEIIGLLPAHLDADDIEPYVQARIALALLRSERDHNREDAAKKTAETLATASLENLQSRSKLTQTDYAFSGQLSATTNNGVSLDDVLHTSTCSDGESIPLTHRPSSLKRNYRSSASECSSADSDRHRTLLRYGSVSLDDRGRRRMKPFVLRPRSNDIQSDKYQDNVFDRLYSDSLRSRKAAESRRQLYAEELSMRYARMQGRDLLSSTGGFLVTSADAASSSDRLMATYPLRNQSLVDSTLHPLQQNLTTSAANLAMSLPPQRLNLQKSNASAFQPESLSKTRLHHQSLMNLAYREASAMKVTSLQTHMSQNEKIGSLETPILQSKNSTQGTLSADQLQLLMSTLLAQRYNRQAASKRNITTPLPDDSHSPGDQDVTKQEITEQFEQVLSSTGYPSIGGASSEPLHEQQPHFQDRLHDLHTNEDETLAVTPSRISSTLPGSKLLYCERPTAQPASSDQPTDNIIGVAPASAKNADKEPLPLVITSLLSRDLGTSMRTHFDTSKTDYPVSQTQNAPFIAGFSSLNNLPLSDSLVISTTGPGSSASERYNQSSGVLHIARKPLTNIDNNPIDNSTLPDSLLTVHSYTCADDASSTSTLARHSATALRTSQESATSADSSIQQTDPNGITVVHQTLRSSTQSDHSFKPDDRSNHTLVLSISDLGSVRHTQSAVLPSPHHETQCDNAVTSSNGASIDDKHGASKYETPNSETIPNIPTRIDEMHSHNQDERETPTESVLSASGSYTAEPLIVLGRVRDYAETQHNLTHNVYSSSEHPSRPAPLHVASRRSGLSLSGTERNVPTSSLLATRNQFSSSSSHAYMPKTLHHSMISVPRTATNLLVSSVLSASNQEKVVSRRAVEPTPLLPNHKQQHDGRFGRKLLSNSLRNESVAIVSLGSRGGASASSKQLSSNETPASLHMTAPAHSNMAIPDALHEQSPQDSTLMSVQQATFEYAKDLSSSSPDRTVFHISELNKSRQ